MVSYTINTTTDIVTEMSLNSHLPCWLTDKFYCDVVYFHQFNDLPYAFQAHIIAKSARKVATKLVGNTDLIRILAVDEEQTKAALMEYETRQGDYSMFGWRDNGNYYSSYQPFKALAR